MSDLPDSIAENYDSVDIEKVEWSDENMIVIFFSDTSYHVWVRRKGEWTLRQ